MMSTVQKKYRGVIVPMISPFHQDLAVDKIAAKKIARFIIEAGAIPFLLGSTGEGLSMSLNQKVELVKAVSEVTRKAKSELYVGISGNSLIGAIEEAQLFKHQGATVLVATLPFYYPIDDNQMHRFFTQLADRVKLPIMLYNMPGMVKKSIPLEVANKLSKHPNIVGLKDSERNEERLQQSIKMWKDRKDFSFFIGWAAMSYTGLKLGADGIVPSTGNLIPDAYVKLYKSVFSDNLYTAEKLQKRTNAVSLVYQEKRVLSYSIPALKKIMEMKEMCQKYVLPPMLTMKDLEEKEFENLVADAFKELKF